MLAKPGEACDSPTTFCDATGACDFDSFLCVASAADGEACTESYDCMSESSCVDMVCALGPAKCD